MNPVDASADDVGRAVVDVARGDLDLPGEDRPDGASLEDISSPKDIPSPQDTASSHDAPGPALDCAALVTTRGVEVCDSAPTRCGVVFTGSVGCAAACAGAGLRCVAGYENVDGTCAANMTLPAVGCASGHVSDYCVCEATTSPCVPTCGARACGVVDDGCGGRMDCTALCPSGAACVSGRCATRVVCTPASCLAFPGAEGEGRFARGGRGGDVYHVTSLTNAGAGTLRDGLTTARDARTIVFDIAGIIDLTATLDARVSRVTIAGQTAPGDGVTVRGYGLVLRGDDNIVQHVRFRAGDIRRATATRAGFTEDSLTVGGDRVMVDHVSASWGIDECLSAATAWDNLTVQHSIIAEGLRRTRLFHGEYVADHPGHSMGGLYKASEGDTHLTIHHTLFAHNNNRNPAIGTYNGTQRQWADLRNNVIYDAPTMGYASGLASVVYLNYVGNYAVFGPDSNTRVMFELDPEDHARVYASGNVLDTDRDGRFDGSDVGWGAIGGSYTRSAETTMEPVVTEGAVAALERVLAGSGARPWSRDGVDRRVVDSVRRQVGGVIDSQEEVGGWGTLAAGTRVVDTDRDGVPDAYETTAGTDPARDDHNADADGDGYTNLENFLHRAARFPG